jgi:hypothetical protein
MACHLKMALALRHSTHFTDWAQLAQNKAEWTKRTSLPRPRPKVPCTPVSRKKRRKNNQFQKNHFCPSEHTQRSKQRQTTHPHSRGRVVQLGTLWFIGISWTNARERARAAAFNSPPEALALCKYFTSLRHQRTGEFTSEISCLEVARSLQDLIAPNPMRRGTPHDAFLRLREGPTKLNPLRPDLDPVA